MFGIVGGVGKGEQVAGSGRAGSSAGGLAGGRGEVSVFWINLPDEYHGRGCVTATSLCISA
jgi:hypothetical protein